MSAPFTITIDDRDVPATRGQTILEAADAAGIWIPRLCHQDGLEPFGACRVCTVIANGRPCAACTQPATPGMVVFHETDELRAWRRSIVEMLFVSGNHFCMVCEKSGHCELQATAYRMGIRAPELEYLFPRRDVDMTHDAIWIDRNRCILCGRCVRTSRDVDGKHLFQFVGRGIRRRLAVDSGAGLAGTRAAITDRAIEACPVGALLRKRTAYRTPIGERPYDREPIGAAVEARAPGGDR